MQKSCFLFFINPIRYTYLENKDCLAPRILPSLRNASSTASIRSPASMKSQNLQNGKFCLPSLIRFLTRLYSSEFHAYLIGVTFKSAKVVTSKLSQQQIPIRPSGKINISVYGIKQVSLITFVSFFLFGALPALLVRTASM